MINGMNWTDAGILTAITLVLLALAFRRSTAGTSGSTDRELRQLNGGRSSNRTEARPASRQIRATVSPSSG